VAFLRETAGDVSNMRSLENRISFAAEMAGLMWFHDSKEAAGMYSAVVNDFKELLLQYDAQLNSLGMSTDDETGGFGLFMGEASERAKLSRKFRIAIAVRQQIALTMAEHEPEMAYNFYNDSINVITNEKLRAEMESRNSNFEHHLMARIAETNATKAAQYAKKSIEKGLTYQTIELLKKIYEKDAEKGAEFGDEILSHLKNTKNSSSNYYIMSSLIEFGSESLEKSRTAGGKKPVFTDVELREIAEVFAQAILNRAENDEDFSGFGYASTIEKYQPARAAQIRAKFKPKGVGAGQRNEIAFNAANIYTIRGSSNSMANAANAGNSNSNTNTARDAEREEREKIEKQLMEDVAKLGTKQLPKEEREKIVAQARKILSLTPGREKKIIGLNALAAQVARAGDKELAAEIMRDVQGLINPNPKNYQDFLFTWMLVAGYAEADPDKAYVLLEDSIYRANELIGAFVRVAEFIDVAEEMVVDGEVQVGAFGGEMIRGLTKEIGIAEATLTTLVRTDFDKTKALTNRFDRPEVRVLAKMLVLRSVLGKKKSSSTMDGSENAEIGTLNTVPVPPPPTRRQN
ncbi:MAG: hypothetical protein ACT4O9_14325, partial [Blastocatellia bacterium]